MNFVLCKNGQAAPVVVEENAINGLAFMAGKFCKDIELVTDCKPQIVSEMPKEEYAVLIATCGDSAYLDKLEAEGKVDLSAIRGKREVYGIFLCDGTSLGVKNLMVVAGSDKRGAVYGMFHISERMGVSAWVYFADATPAKKAELIFDESLEMVSKEPSVTYRGFFINDEQPCLGNWAKEKFGSHKPTPELYEHIFELLLRLKGNYLWPAMWRSDFTLDHIENAILADKMGVIVGNSHHEPCCRSGQEFQILRHEHPEYGKEWSFLSNAEGISKFWEDGLKRNQPYESLITIGMRGESDSYLMPEDATLEDNINVLKNAITAQKKLIKEYGNQQHPQLLAIYKEVEDYYQGDENTVGLKDWDVLENDIMMLCDDNFGYLRTMPSKEERKHPGGYGMYYHFDYFGGPTSYLWMNTTPLAKTWEQMSMAYDFGVQEAWIVNVGDIKNQELSLSYFIDLAYDFDKWGTDGINKTTEYAKQWIASLGFTDAKYEGLGEALEEYVRINGICRPEVIKADTYHPCHFNEAKSMLARVDKLTSYIEDLWLGMDENDALRDCFFEVVYYPVMASTNIIRMQIYAGLNQYYASLFRKTANTYIPRVEECIKKDRELTNAYHSIKGGKWNHMQSVYHIGYTQWNDEFWQYPQCRIYYPVNDPRLQVNICGQDVVTGGNSWSRKPLGMHLAAPAMAEGFFDVSNGGEGILEYRITWDADWLTVLPAEGTETISLENGLIFAKVEDCATFIVRLDAEKMQAHLVGTNASDALRAVICVHGDNCEETADFSENDGSVNRVDITVSADIIDSANISEGTFVEHDGFISIEAPHFYRKREGNHAQWKTIENFGRTLGGVKVFPTTSQFAQEGNAPVLEYKIYVKEAGSYRLELFTAPNNPIVYKGKMQVGIGVNKGVYRVLNTIPDEGYIPWISVDWEEGVLSQIHKMSTEIELIQGENTISVKAMDPAVVLQKLVIAREDVTVPDSYLGPNESYMK